MKSLTEFFKLKERNTSIKIELIAGLTTFMTMVYVLAIQPAAIVGFGPDPSLVDINGLVVSKEAIMLSTALVTAIVTIFMAFFTNMPFALSCGMGMNFMLGGMIQAGAISFAGAITMIFISGVLFVLLSIFGVRSLIMRMIPKNIKTSVVVLVGFFIAYLGFTNSGIVTTAKGLAFGDIKSPAVLLALGSLLLIALLTAYKVKGAVLISIVATTIIGIPLGVTQMPGQFVSLPSFGSMSNVMFKLSFKEVLSWTAVPLIFVLFVSDFFCSLSAFLGIGAKAKLLDSDGNFPNIEKPFLVDSIGTVFGAFCGATTITTYAESATGVEEGGRTGMTSLVVGILFLLTLFMAPLFLMIPNAATGPALIFVGLIMVMEIEHMDFSDFTDYFGPVMMIFFSIFTANIATGISAGILSYIFIKVATRKFKEVHPGLYVLSIFLICYFIFAA